jgi:hypothetical protein
MTLRRRYALVAVAGTLVMGFGALFLHTQTGRSLHPDKSHVVGEPWQLGSPEHRARIDTIIRALKSESLQQSCSHMYDDPDQYFYPGYYSGKKGHQINLEVMLSNRRCVKVVEQLVELSEDVRDDECKTTFGRLFSAHTVAMRAACQHAENPGAPKNTQSLKDTQLALCAVMFATAKAASTRMLVFQFDALTEFENEMQRRVLDGGNNFTMDFRLGVQRYVIPDNRFRLNVLLLHAAQMKDAALNEARRLFVQDFPNAEVAIPGWAAATTPFDVVHRMEGVPIDESKGVQTYTFFDWPGEKFHKMDAQKRIVDDLLEQIRSVL